jgi:hypothetical protein
VTAPEALAFLAKERRTVLLGGAAVILHGMNRSTKDFDIWMDPHPDADTWAAPIRHLLEQDPSLRLLRIAPLPQLWNPVTIEKLPVVLMSAHWAGSFSMKCWRRVILSQRI